MTSIIRIGISANSHDAEMQSGCRGTGNEGAIWDGTWSSMLQDRMLLAIVITSSARRYRGSAVSRVPEQRSANDPCSTFEFRKRPGLTQRQQELRTLPDFIVLDVPRHGQVRAGKMDMKALSRVRNNAFKPIP